jgi:hypothetical protein
MRSEDKGFETELARIANPRQQGICHGLQIRARRQNFITNPNSAEMFPCP